MKRENNKAEQIFNSDGTIRETELKIMNLRPMGNKMATDSAGIAIKKWEEVSTECNECFPTLYPF